MFYKQFHFSCTDKPRVVNPVGDSQRVNSKKVGVLTCEFYGQPDRVIWKRQGVDVTDQHSDFR